MREKPILAGIPEKGPTAKGARVERRFCGERSAEDMLRSLIRAHAQSM